MAFRGMGMDLGASCRSLRRQPSFLVTVILTIGLGTAAPIGMMGVAHQVLLKPLPYSEPENLRLVQSVLESTDRMGLTGAELQDFNDALENLPVSSATAFIRPSLDARPTRTDTEIPQSLRAIRAQLGFFEVLGVRPALGTGFSELPSSPAGREVILSHEYWLNREGANPALVGDTISIDGMPYRVAGVLPREFEFPWRGETPQLWIKWEPSPALLADRDARVIGLITRLMPGTGVDNLLAALEPVLKRSRNLSPAAPAARFEGPALHQIMLGGTRVEILLLAAASGIAFVIALLNLSLLVTARVLKKAPELAIRRALGGSRADVARPLLAEALILCLAGALLGLMLATAGTTALLALVPGAIPRLETLTPDPVLVATTLGLGLVTAITAFLLPAIRTPVRGLMAVRSGDGRPAVHWRKSLTAIQTAMLFLLLAATYLSARSVVELGRVDPGFEPRGKLTVSWQLSDRYYSDRQTLYDMLEGMESRLTALGEVKSAGVITNLPLNPANMSGPLFIQGRDNLASQRSVVDWELVSPGYLQAAGIRLLRGRGIESSDGPTGRLVTVVSETLATRLRPDGDVMGMRISAVGTEGPWREIVGIVNDVRQQGLPQDPRGFMYVPAAQVSPFSSWEWSLVVAPQAGNAMALWPRVHRVLRELDPGSVIGDPAPFSALVTASMADSRFRATLVGVFGLVALMLGMIGLNGLIHQNVTARNREFAIRLALGASKIRILRMILSLTEFPVALGLVVGISATLMISPYFEALLFRTSPREPIGYVIIAILLLFVSAVAALGPALKAASTEPARVLRGE